jgi:anti-sigma-K factor RskA
VDYAGDHELSAAYALDALERRERSAFEAHLGICTVCAEELPSLRAAAAALAYCAQAPTVPTSVRTGLLGNLPELRSAPVVALWRRVALPVASALAVGAAAAGVALAIRPPGHERPVVVSVENRPGSLVLTRESALLVLPGLPPAPIGTTYEAWVTEGERTWPAGTFRGGPGRIVVVLQRSVPAGARVAVSLEPRGGSNRPTGPLLVRTERA